MAQTWFSDTINYLRQTEDLKEALDTINTVKSYAEANHQQLEVLKEWINEMSECATVDRTKLAQTLNSNLATVNSQTAEIKNQLEVLKSLVVKTLQVDS